MDPMFLDKSIMNRGALYRAILLYEFHQWNADDNKFVEWTQRLSERIANLQKKQAEEENKVKKEAITDELRFVQELLKRLRSKMENELNATKTGKRKPLPPISIPFSMRGPMPSAQQNTLIQYKDEEPKQRRDDLLRQRLADLSKQFPEAATEIDSLLASMKRKSEGPPAKKVRFADDDEIQPEEIPISDDASSPPQSNSRPSSRTAVSLNNFLACTPEAFLNSPPTFWNIDNPSWQTQSSTSAQTAAKLKETQNHQRFDSNQSNYNLMGNTSQNSPETNNSLAPQTPHTNIYSQLDTWYHYNQPNSNTSYNYLFPPQNNVITALLQQPQTSVFPYILTPTNHTNG